MKTVYLLPLAVVAGSMASIASAWDPKPQPRPVQPKVVPITAEFSRSSPQVVSVINLTTGQVVTPGAPAPAPRGMVVGFDNLSLPGSAAQMNVAYVQPGSYDGSNPSSTASIFGLGNGPVGSLLRAPSNATFPNPTHIVWNDYTGDADIWPTGAGNDAVCLEFNIVVAYNNTGLPARTDTLRILFFSADEQEFKGGFQVNYNIAAGAFAYARLNVDLSALNPPLMVPQDGLVMADYPPPEGQTQVVGVGLSFAGGDLVNTNYPHPLTLIAVGTADPNFWVFTDGILGDAEHPMGPDPDFDGMPGLSYLDLLNTGVRVNWQFTSTTPGGAIGTRTLTHDFPVRMVVSATTNTGACTVPGFCFITTEELCTVQGGTYQGNGTTCPTGACDFFFPKEVCIVTTQEECLAQGGVYQGDDTTCPVVCPCDWDDDGAVNSQDFFNFLNDFFAGNADFNDDGMTNSQDFFDFLNCFFNPGQHGC